MSKDRAITAGNMLLIAAAAVIVIAGLKYAAPVLVPFLLSIFIAVLLLPVVRWLVNHRVPEALALVLIMVVFILFAVMLASFLGSTVNAFYQDLPIYEEKLQHLMVHSIAWLNTQGIEISESIVRDSINPSRIMGTVASVFNGLSGALTSTFLIVFTVIFILLEASGFAGKVKRAFGETTQALQHFERIAQTVQEYLVLKTFISLATGLLVWLCLLILDVPYSSLWGLAAFLLNYIPNIGSIIAAVPALLVSLITQDILTATLVATMYIIVNTVIGNMIEPRVMGRSLGLSSLVVFMSLVFWGWLWGPIGMILSIPLTMSLKIALETNVSTRWLSVLLDR